MPIKGLTEKRRLPRLGKIHLGVKKVNERGVEYPSAVDYFVCPPEVQKVFGEKPKELRILIPVEDEERWASQYYRCYSLTRGLICKGDGEIALRMVDTKTGGLANRDTKEVAMKEAPCQGRECPDYKIQCKEVMNLQFLLPEVPGIGIWQVDTGSINSILNINSATDICRRLYGRISMIPLLLTCEPQEVKTPDGKKKTVWVLNLRSKDTLEVIAGAARKSMAQYLLAESAEADEAEMPVGDDEVPELIIPQNQEPEKSPAPTPAPPTEKPKAGAPSPQTSNEELEKTIRPGGPLFKTWGELAFAAVKLTPPVYPNEIWEHAKVSLWADFKDFNEAWEHVLAIVKERQLKAK